METLESRQLLTTFTVVNTLGDGSIGSQGYAVEQANSTSGADTIEFDSVVFSISQTITLTSGQLELTDAAETTITGPGAPLVISGNHASRVLQLGIGATAALTGLTISDGSAVFGSGIANDGTLFLANCIFTGNSAEFNGGALINADVAIANIFDCTFEKNSATFGAGVTNVGGDDDHRQCLPREHCLRQLRCDR